MTTQTDLLEASIAIKRLVRHCADCSLHSLHAGPIPFSGAVPSEVVVVGDWPDVAADGAQKPFAGTGMKVLREVLGKGGLIPKDMAYLNTVSCHPGENKRATDAETQTCRLNLKMQLELLKPSFIILAGGGALKAFRPDLKIAEVHGKPLLLGNGEGYGQWHISWPGFNDTHMVVLFPIYHPNYMAIKRVARDTAIAELRSLYAIHEDPLDGWPEDCYRCGSPADFYDAWAVPLCGPHYYRQEQLFNPDQKEDRAP